MSKAREQRTKKFARRTPTYLTPVERLLVLEALRAKAREFRDVGKHDHSDVVEDVARRFVDRKEKEMKLDKSPDLCFNLFNIQETTRCP